eukprot:3200703-Prymnesium_polylepis.1
MQTRHARSPAPTREPQSPKSCSQGPRSAPNCHLIGARLGCDEASDAPHEGRWPADCSAGRTTSRRARRTQLPNSQGVQPNPGCCAARPSRSCHVRSHPQLDIDCHAVLASNTQVPGQRACSNSLATTQ